MQIERRFHPRMKASFEVNIFTDNSSDTIKGEASNISLSGIQLAVSKSTIETILNWGNHPQQFFITFTVDGLELAALKVRLIVNRRISNQQFALGLKFIQMSPEQQQKLNQLLSKLKAAASN